MRVFAPGKIVLMGEYAVLDGAPAVVAAVSAGVSCTVTSASALTIETPYDDRFVRPALEAVRARAARYRFEDAPDLGLSTKPGLGGSAASVVAAVLAGAPDLGVDERARIAKDVHHRIQGSGSGIDVLASTYGGVLRVQAGAVSALPDIRVTVVFSGQSAKTGPRVAQYRALANRTGFVQATSNVVACFVSEPIAAMREQGALLRAMATEAGISYATPALDALRDLADELGGACKPSGAGGGDIAVAVFPDDDARVTFAQGCKRLGLVVLPVSTSAGATTS